MCANTVWANRNVLKWTSDMSYWRSCLQEHAVFIMLCLRCEVMETLCFPIGSFGFGPDTLKHIVFVRMVCTPPNMCPFVATHVRTVRPFSVYMIVYERCVEHTCGHHHSSVCWGTALLLPTTRTSTHNNYLLWVVGYVSIVQFAPSNSFE